MPKDAQPCTEVKSWEPRGVCCDLPCCQSLSPSLRLAWTPWLGRGEGAQVGQRGEGQPTSLEMDSRRVCGAHQAAAYSVVPSSGDSRSPFLA